MFISVFGLSSCELRRRLPQFARQLEISGDNLNIPPELAGHSEEILEGLGEYLVSAEGLSLSQVCVRELTKASLTIATAESCTGGLLAGAITSVPGSSQVFELGLVTYANWAKNAMLGVTEETLGKYGAVSSHTAAEMARGVRKLARATFAISVTGIAGPDGGTSEKPVGLVYLCLAAPEGIFVRRLLCERQTREDVRASSVNHALDMLRRRLLRLPMRECDFTSA